MPVYEFKCPVDGSQFSITATIEHYSKIRNWLLCPHHRSHLVRVYSPPVIKPSMPAHYNPTVGKWVRSMSEFKSELSRASDEASERTGLPHHFVPHEAGDYEAAGLTEERAEAAISARDRRLRDAGITSSDSPSSPPDRMLVVD
jgi:hypothetical protein